MEPWSWIWMFVWIGVLVGIVWLLVREGARRPSEDALAILRTRFARGELTPDEFERARTALLLDQQEETR
jgi:putative membrane protein